MGPSGHERSVGAFWATLKVLLMQSNDDPHTEFGKLLATAKGGDHDALDQILVMTEERSRPPRRAHGFGGGAGASGSSWRG